MSTFAWMVLLFGALVGFLAGFGLARGWFKGPQR